MKKLLVVYYGGQYTTVGNFRVIKSTGTELAVTRLYNKTRREQATFGDNHAGWILPIVKIYDVTDAGIKKNDIKLRQGNYDGHYYYEYIGDARLLICTPGVNVDVQEA